MKQYWQKQGYTTAQPCCPPHVTSRYVPPFPGPQRHIKPPVVAERITPVRPRDSGTITATVRGGAGLPPPVAPNLSSNAGVIVARGGLYKPPRVMLDRTNAGTITARR